MQICTSKVWHLDLLWILQVLIFSRQISESSLSSLIICYKIKDILADLVGSGSTLP